MNKIRIISSSLALILAPFSVESNSHPPHAINNESEIDLSIDEAIQNSTKEVKTPHVEDIKVMTPNANKELKNQVVQDTNNELKFTIKKFLFAMLGVALSSVIIFLVLTVMNKMTFMQNLKAMNKEEDESLIKDEIVIPSGENDALKIFFEKTR